MNAKREPLFLKSKIATFWVFFFILMLLVVAALGPVCPPDCEPPAIQNARMLTSHNLGLALSLYAGDHDGHYPEGKTSTEIFQHLIDENDVTDPSIFYVEMAGKVPPKSNHLKPENVCWDVTCCVDNSAPDDLPVVFLTGFKITYAAGSPAVPINPPAQKPERTWAQWWNGEKIQEPFIAVCYKNYSAKSIKADGDGSIPNFIPADFNPRGKTYRQLTP